MTAVRLCVYQFVSADSGTPPARRRYKLRLARNSPPTYHAPRPIRPISPRLVSWVPGAVAATLSPANVAGRRIYEPIVPQGHRSISVSMYITYSQCRMRIAGRWQVI